MFARLFAATALHRFMDTTKCPDISHWNLISIRGLVFQLPPSLAAPSDPPSAGPPSPETNQGKGNTFNDHPSWKTNPARPPHPLLEETPVHERKYLGNSGFDALVLHQLRHHCPAKETNPEVSGKAA